MGSKVFVLLSLLLANVLLISSEEAAKDHADTSFYDKNVHAAKEKMINGLDDHNGKHIGAGYEKFPGLGRSGWPIGYPGYPGGWPGTNPGGWPGSNPGGWSSYGDGPRGFGGTCLYGCCSPSFYGMGCSRCCNFLGQLNAETEAKPHN